MAEARSPVDPLGRLRLAFVPLLVFLGLQRSFVRGIVTGSVKG